MVRNDRSGELPLTNCPSETHLGDVAAVLGGSLYPVEDANCSCRLGQSGLEIAEQYRDRDRHLAAATVYRAVFEEVDEKYDWIDGAYDHYAQTIQTALDGYVDCVLATDPSPEEFDTYAGVLEARATAEPQINSEQFWRALDDLEERYE